KCVQVLQKYNVPYYVFTKSAIIERDLELHRQYRHNCFIVWSITTCDERIRRIVEPGTPPVTRIFEAIKKFTDAGVCCGVNVDPILPLVTDTQEGLKAVVRSCKQAGLNHVFGAVLRLRTDIWERMKLTLQMLGIPDGVNRYRQIYNFEEPLDANYVSADKNYTEKIISRLDGLVRSCGMACDFPDFIGPGRIDRSHLGQITLHNYLV
ncbi:MAG TPA: hypothetical protein VI338_00710, partial [Nitrososphaera sp.]|nr:hypothetical protein [Nitrososphaera sp.]